MKGKKKDQSSKYSKKDVFELKVRASAAAESSRPLTLPARLACTLVR